MTVFLANDHTSLHSSVSSLCHSPWAAHAWRGWALVSVHRHFSVSQEMMLGVNHSICVLLVAIVLLNTNLYSSLTYLPLQKKIVNKDLCILFLLSSLVSWPCRGKASPQHDAATAVLGSRDRINEVMFGTRFLQHTQSLRCLQAPSSVSCAILLAIASFCPLCVPWWFYKSLPSPQRRCAVHEPWFWLPVLPD